MAADRQADSRIAGVLLAGGQSRRMFAGGAGSGDKGLLTLDDRPMLAHVAERFSRQVGTLAINANGDPARFAAFGLPIVPDSLGGFVGPLAGVLAGMRWAANETDGVQLVATVSTDAPFFPDDLVERLSAALAVSKGGERIAIARSGGHLHPVIGLWPVELADDLEAALAQGVRKVLAWTDRHGTLAVDFPNRHIGGEVVDPFFNANTPEELAEARRLIAADQAR